MKRYMEKTSCGIKQIINFKPKSSLRISKVVLHDSEITSEALKNYFFNIGNDLASAIPSVDKSPLDYLRYPVPNSFFILPVSSSEIEIEISKLQNGKATIAFHPVF